VGVQQRGASASRHFRNSMAMKANVLACRFDRSCRYWDGSVRSRSVPRAENALKLWGLWLLKTMNLIKDYERVAML
jgi:hypothetical protein